jgi:Zinc ribbon domain
MKPANENEFLALRNSEHTMPIYEYHCLECGATFEKIVSLKHGVDRLRSATVLA